MLSNNPSLTATPEGGMDYEGVDRSSKLCAIPALLTRRVNRQGNVI